MTGAIAGACYGIEGIPSQGRKTVENREYIEPMGKRLWEVKMGMGNTPEKDAVAEIAEDGI